MTEFFFSFAACMRSNILCGAQVSCCHPVSQGPSDWFCSSDTCHPVSSLPKVCFLSPLLQHKDWGLGLTGYCYKPTSYLFFSSCVRWLVTFFFFFLKQKQNSFGAWEKILDEETIFMLTWLVSCHRCVRYNMVRVKLFFAHCLHFVMEINENKNLLIASSFTVVCILS